MSRSLSNCCSRPNWPRNYAWRPFSSSSPSKSSGGIGTSTPSPAPGRICLRCGKVEEFFGEPLQRLRKQIEAHFGFEIVLARTEVGGYCSHCQVLRSQEMEEAAEAHAATAVEGRTRSPRRQ